MNSKGFVVIHLLAVLPFALAIMLAFYVFLGFSDTYIEVKNTCLRDQIQTLEYTKKSLRDLRALNPRANQLYFTYLITSQKLAAAIATGNNFLIFKLMAQLQKIRQKRELLHQTQKAIIKGANNFLRLQNQSTERKIKTIGEKRKTLFSFFLDLNLSDIDTKKTKLAIVPDSNRLAPSYSLAKNFLNDQALAIHWSLNMKSQGFTQRFLPFNHRFSQSCSTTINNQEEKWPIVIHEVKFLLKP